MRVALVLPGLSAGGTERVVSLLANHWAARGWLVSIVTMEEPGTAPYYPLDPRITIVQLALPAIRRPLSAETQTVVRRILALRRALRALAPDVVIAFLTRANIVTLLATRGSGLPVIVSERNNAALQSASRVWRWLRAHLYRRAHGVVTMTPGAHDHLARTTGARGRVIPNFVDPGVVDLPQTPGTVLTAAGRLVPQKGFDLLLEAFARIAAAFPEWRLVIWGEGSERAALEAQRDRLGLGERVQLPGISSTPGAWLATAGVFVLSSRFEGWGNVLLEAMAAGRPVVAFDCPWGPREMITDGRDGLLVPCGDVAALAEALARLLGDPALRLRLAAAARVSTRRFSIDRIAPRWDALVLAALRPDKATKVQRSEQHGVA